MFLRSPEPSQRQDHCISGIRPESVFSRLQPEQPDQRQPVLPAILNQIGLPPFKGFTIAPIEGRSGLNLRCAMRDSYATQGCGKANGAQKDRDADTESHEKRKG